MSLAITVDLLTGRYVATAPTGRDDHEWPPEPARLFSAMVAALHDTDDPSPAERAALEWLERQSPPTIAASEGEPRSTLTHFVPINDTSVLGTSLTDRGYAKVVHAQDALQEASTEAKRRSADKKVARARDVGAAVAKIGKTPAATAQKMLPGHRPRRGRTYPSVTPATPAVSYRWDDVDAPPEVIAGLTTLLERVTRLGHSSTMVWARLDDDPPDATLIPDIEGDETLRTTGRGQLAALERRFAERAMRSGSPDAYQDDGPRFMPSAMTRYRWAHDRARRAAITSAMAGEWLVLEQVGGPRVGILRAQPMAEAVRGALVAHLPTQHPLVTGHRADSRPVTDSHLAVVPLPFVGHRHASGIVMGVALALPSASPLLDGRDALLDALGHWERTDTDRLLPLHLSGGRRVLLRRTAYPQAQTLQRRTWVGPARQWATATPVALDRFPKHWSHRSEQKRAAAEAAARTTVMRACRMVGLPDPAEVEISTTPILTGTEPARRHPALVSGKGDRAVRRLLLHCAIRFPEDVEGPVVLGAGRYLGVGLLRPLWEGSR